MREIKVVSWNVQDGEGKTHSEDLLMLLNLLVLNKDPKELPRGYEQFKLFSKLTKAFEKASETKILILEEDIYKFLRTMVERDIPSIWGTSRNIVEAVELFMNATEN